MPVLFIAIATIAAASPQSPGDTSEWEMPAAVLQTTETFALEPKVLDGPFELTATITLQTMDGTAASVFVGETFNFGFDSRGGNLFVEGSSIGRTRSLMSAQRVIEPGKQFQLKVTRGKSDLLAISINDKEVYRANLLKGPVGYIRFRPRRNTMSVTAASLSGRIAVAAEGLEARDPVVPILNDGSDQTLSEFTLTTRRPRTLKQIVVSFHGTTQRADLQRIVVKRSATHGTATPAVAEFSDDHSEDATAHSSPRPTSSPLTGEINLAAGTHSFLVSGVIRKNAKLTNRVAASVVSVEFADGTTFKNADQPQAPLRLAFNIHKRGQHNCHTFRIPAIARTNSGTLLAVYDMRYNSRKDLQEHMDIGLSRSTDGGQTWSAPVPIMDMGEYGGLPEKQNGCSDPGILVDANTGEIFVTACWTHGKPGTHQWSGKGSGPGFDIGKTTQFMLVRSTDDGVNWTEPENLTRQLKQESWWLFAPAPTVGITLKDGTLVMATQGRDETGRPFSNIMHSRDHGKTWTVSKSARDDCSECTVAELTDGRVMLNIRDNRNRKEKGDRNGRAVSVTSDLGETWTVHSTDHKSLPAPVCNASLLRHTLKDGRNVLLFSNPRTKTSRTTMTIQASLDDGVTWPVDHHVLLDEAGGAYSGLVMVDDNTVGILYESSAADFVFQQIPLSEILPSNAP